MLGLIRGILQEQESIMAVLLLTAEVFLAVPVSSIGWIQLLDSDLLRIRWIRRS